VKRSRGNFEGSGFGGAIGNEYMSDKWVAVTAETPLNTQVSVWLNSGCVAADIPPTLAVERCYHTLHSQPCENRLSTRTPIQWFTATDVEAPYEQHDGKAPIG
jgi:hypothetical protein